QLTVKQRQSGPDLVYPEEATEAEVARCSGRASGASWADPHRPAPNSTRGRRQRRGAALASVPGKHGLLEGPPQEPPAIPGAVRQRRQPLCRGFQGCFSFGGEAAEGLLP